jgi:hypothetical protein
MSTRSLADALSERLLDVFPADQAYTKADWAADAMPSPLRHYLTHLLRHHHRRETRQLRRARTDWVNYDHPEMEQAAQAFLDATEQHLQVPRDQWADTLRTAARRTTGYLVRPVPTLMSFIFEDTAGETTRGVDLDALRMYLRWRGTTLSTLRADPDRHRDPASITETRPPGDGNVDRTLDIEMERTEANPVDGDPDGGHDRREDPWGADRFADEVGTPYGTTPEVLREGLETVTRTDEVWVSPGLPFMVPLFFGLVTAFTIGDVFFASLGLFGAV